MKSLQEFRNVVVEEEKQDFTKFDALVRAGLANKAQLQRLHQILGKMGEEHPSFNNADRQIIQNMFTKMVDLITNNPQIYRTARKAVSEDVELEEGVHDTADYKVGKDGKKVRAHRFAIGDKSDSIGDAEFKEETSIEEAFSDTPGKTPPFVLLLKRQAIRIYPNNTKIALYYNEKLGKYFSIPFVGDKADMIQAQESADHSDMCNVCGQTPCNCTHLDEAVMDTLHKIVSGKSGQSVKFASGHTRKVDMYTASAITQVHKALNDANKKKFADMVHKSPEHFSKAAEFAFSKAK